ncbi:MAG: ROK family protein [Labilibaculum antarcticum]
MQENNMGDFQFETEFVNQLARVEKKRYVQQIKIVKTLYIDGPQSTSSLCKRLKISAPNMMTILGEMLGKRIVEKKGQGKSIGGRKPDLYGVTSESFYVVGVEMGIYKTKITLFNATNEQLTEVEEYPILLNNELDTINVIVEVINSFIERSGIDRKEVLGIGMSMPGLVDSVNGINHTYLNYDNKPVADLLEEKIGRPVFIENDAKAMALAEFRLGCAKDKKDVLVLYLDWGIGLGMILDGKLYRGTSGFAGEFSHIPMVENGRLCRCGRLGCVETVASGIRVLQMAEEGVKAGKSSIVLEDNDLKHRYLGLKNVIKAALEGDQYAIGILDETGKNLGKGISTLIQLFNPELIVLCGKLAESGDLIVTPIQQGINTHAMKQISERANIVVTDFGTDIGMFGALAVIMENIFDNYIENYGG